MVMNCIEALEMLESREVFFLETDWTISLGQNREKCMMTLNSQSVSNTPVVVGNCGDPGYNQWVINQNGQIQLKIKDTMCMQAISGDTISDVALYQEVEASSQSADDNHTPQMVVDGSDSSYWSSN